MPGLLSVTAHQMLNGADGMAYLARFSVCRSHLLLGSLGFVLTCTVNPAGAAPQLVVPLDCRIDEDCYIQQFTDMDPGAGAVDFQCGALTYDGHKGTDFALHSLAAQAAGVTVRAAATGRVIGIRNDMADVLQLSPDAPDVTGRECGNGLVIDHGDGWETQYCHMAQGSVSVTPGQTVSAGDALGKVGLSGQTQFPHLHLSLRHNGQVVDPFDPAADPACGPAQSLWASPIPTPPGGLIASGFADAVPSYNVIKAGGAAAETLATTAPALVLWTYLFGSQPGDDIRLTISGPDDSTVFDQTIPLDRQQAQAFRAAGRRTPQGGWPAGQYTGTATHSRDDRILDQQTVTVTLR